MNDRRITTKDPALVALNKIARVLEQHDRAAQLRIMGATCMTLGLFDYAEQFTRLARAEAATGPRDVNGG